MTDAIFDPGSPEAIVHAAAEACAAVLPASTQLAAGDPQPGTEHVVSVFAGAATTDLGGALTGAITVLVGEELVQALQASPLGGLDVAAAVQPALDAAAAVLGATAAAARTLDLELVVDSLSGPFIAVPLLGAGIDAALLVPDAVLQQAVAQASGGAGAAAATTAPGSGQPRGDQPGVAGQALPDLGAAAGALPDNVRSLAPGRRGIEMLHGVEMEVTVELGRTRMAVRDLLALAPGAVLALDRAAGSPADLLVNGRLIARGEVVVIDEDFGLRVTEILDQSAVG
ncbi:flagellar motor switch protein FliN [Nocardioides sp. R-C-SC26]|uniref:flagellar motor switch protein FliN n=1 Tax=Nocardioides sp. R-C-SC26 TaxID=2870414 RepID=UPI001E3272B6|nr:flagellar motor switch protein FliN [Nocardioides sp. R-C-SC26]